MVHRQTRSAFMSRLKNKYNFVVLNLLLFSSSFYLWSFFLFFCILGWMMGERLHDSERGWFPSRVVEEIQSKEVRTQNLREVFRIQQAQQEGGGGLQAGARFGSRPGRRTPKVSSFSNSWTDQTGDSSEVTH